MFRGFCSSYGIQERRQYFRKLDLFLFLHGEVETHSSPLVEQQGLFVVSAPGTVIGVLYLFILKDVPFKRATRL
jgi:hypothetical protein